MERAWRVERALFLVVEVLHAAHTVEALNLFQSTLLEVNCPDLAGPIIR